MPAFKEAPGFSRGEYVTALIRYQCYMFDATFDVFESGLVVMLDDEPLGPVN